MRLQMKVVLLAGGLGTRLSEETLLRPKPLVEIGGRPILWHIMKIFSTYGFNDFIICAGYKGYMIKDYFSNYTRHNSNITVDMTTGHVELETVEHEPWRVTIVDTGENTLTGGRIKRVLPYLGDDAEFMMTYGDGVADIDLPALIAHHKAERRIATVSGAQPPGRFGQLSLNGNEVVDFLEKPEGEGGWINAGFFILPKSIGAYISGDQCTFEREPLERLSTERQLTIYKHSGFWLPMDSLRDKANLENLWDSGKAPWKIW
jgi:glucose-1-phosphate cytidylyltransferase